jgi:hypothetical protein
VIFHTGVLDDLEVALHAGAPGDLDLRLPVLRLGSVSLSVAIAFMSECYWSKLGAQVT